MAQNQKSEATRPWLGDASAGRLAALAPVGTERLLLFLSAAFVAVAWVQLVLLQLCAPGDRPAGFYGLGRVIRRRARRAEPQAARP